MRRDCMLEKSRPSNGDSLKFLVLVITAFLVTACSSDGAGPGAAVVILDPPVQLDDGWQVSTLEAQGMNPVVIGELVREIEQGEFDLIHALLIVRHGHLVYEGYYAPGHDRNTHHLLASVTKSITSVLMGIAVGGGFVEDVEASAADFFPEYSEIFQADPAKRSPTVRHHLTMTSGMEWIDGLGFEGNNDSHGLWHSPDPIRYVLEKRIIREPGSQFEYNDGSTMLLAGIIDNTTGLNADEFAGVHLFGPLGISDYNWRTVSSGVTDVDGGLRMRGRDLAKIGQLILQNGTWDGTQIIPETWVTESTTDWVDTGGGYHYGYQWWLDRLNAAPGIEPEWNDIVIGSGYGGQKLYVVPKLDLVVVFFGCEVEGCPPETDFVPRYSLTEFIIAAIDD